MLSVTLFLVTLDNITGVFPKPVKYILSITVHFSLPERTCQQIFQNCLKILPYYGQQTGIKCTKSKTTVTIFSREKEIQNHELLYLGQRQITRMDNAQNPWPNLR